MTSRAVRWLLQRADAYAEDARYLESRKPDGSMKPNNDSDLIGRYRWLETELRTVAADLEHEGSDEGEAAA